MSFDATVTEDERVLVTWEGRTVVTVAGAPGRRLAHRLASAPDADARQLLLARATGNFKRGNER
ncbi:MAG TPA: hypothetical protein VFM67_05270 [Gaiella sp.]|jgi:hypothetical protein|nr:hypothetical protein [Gaiella sp.]